jgi:hypothetical protein
MKTLHNIIKTAVGVFLLAALMVSCVPEQQSMGDAGQTIVKIRPAMEGGFKLIVLEPVTTPQTFELLDIRRDIPNNADLMSTTVVELTINAGVLGPYNTENETQFEILPTNVYNTVPAASGGKYTLTFNPGEIQKTITLNIPNAYQLDFGKQYALGYVMKVISGPGLVSETSGDSLICQILPKNVYDGVYTVTALSPMVDVLNSGLTGYYPFTYHLITTGANTCDAYLIDVENDGYWDGYYHPITSGGAMSVYGSFGLTLTFDPTTGAVTSLTNPWGNPPSNTRMPALDPSGVNKWDSQSKNITLKYWMKQPSLVPDPPNIRTSYDEFWTYKGKRP